MNRFVLITRHPADCTQLQEKLTPSGITLRPYPVLRLEDVENDAGWDAVDRIARSDDRPVWLFMASPRAPERVVAQCRKRNTEWLLDIPVAVIGAGHRRRIVRGRSRTGSYRTGNRYRAGRGLHREADRTLHGDLRLRPPPTSRASGCAQSRRSHGGAAGGLPHASNPARELPPLGPSLDAVVVTSPRATRLYLDGVGGHPLPCPHWALGPTTRDAARSLGIECLIPPEPSIDSLAEELCRI